MPVYQNQLTIRLRPSRIGRAAFLALALLAFVAITYADVPLYAVVAAVLYTFVLTFYAWRTPIPLELRLLADGKLAVRHPAQTWQTAQVLPRTTVNPWLTVLAYRLEGERRVRSITLLPDNLGRDDFRRLRVWLRWRADTADTAPR